MHINYHAKNKRVGLAPLGRAGFTLVEVTIVAGIIITGMVAVQTAVQYGLRAAVASTDGIVAAHLAEEGLELVRNIRDTNWAKEAAGAGAQWTTWYELDNGTYLIHYPLTGSGGRLSPLGGSPSCSAVQELDFDPATGLYGYTAWSGWSGFGNPDVSPSRFARIVTITNNSTHIVVDSRVCWTDPNGGHEILITEHLYDWRP